MRSRRRVKVKRVERGRRKVEERGGGEGGKLNVVDGSG